MDPVPSDIVVPVQEGYMDRIRRTYKDLTRFADMLKLDSTDEVALDNFRLKLNRTLPANPAEDDVYRAVHNLFLSGSGGIHFMDIIKNDARNYHYIAFTDGACIGRWFGLSQRVLIAFERDSYVVSAKTNVRYYDDDRGNGRDDRGRDDRGGSRGRGDRDSRGRGVDRGGSRGGRGGHPDRNDRNNSGHEEVSKYDRNLDRNKLRELEQKQREAERKTQQELREIKNMLGSFIAPGGADSSRPPEAARAPEAAKPAEAPRGEAKSEATKPEPPKTPIAPPAGETVIVDPALVASATAAPIKKKAGAKKRAAAAAPPPANASAPAPPDTSDFPIPERRSWADDE
jgi:hypothetical protein